MLYKRCITETALPKLMILRGWTRLVNECFQTLGTQLCQSENKYKFNISGLFGYKPGKNFLARFANQT